MGGARTRGAVVHGREDMPQRRSLPPQAIAPPTLIVVTAEPNAVASYVSGSEGRHPMKETLDRYRASICPAFTATLTARTAGPETRRTPPRRCGPSISSRATPNGWRI